MRRLPVCCFSLAAVFVSTPLFAQAGASDTGLSAAALLGFATDDLNLGLGARVGYTLPAMPFYVGGTFVYHLGTSESTPVGDVSAHLYYFGAEGGYSISAGPVIIRPYLGLGAATATASLPGGSASDTKFAAWPGGALLFPLGSAFVGGDVRFLLVSNSNAFGAFATGGLHF